MSYVKINEKEIEVKDIAEFLKKQYPGKIEIQLQAGSIKKNGINGAQVKDIIDVLIAIMQDFDNRLPCEDNLSCISSLRSARLRLIERSKKREFGIKDKRSKLC